MLMNMVAFGHVCVVSYHAHTALSAGCMGSGHKTGVSDGLTLNRTTRYLCDTNINTNIRLSFAMPSDA